VPFTLSHPAAVLPLARAPRWLFVPSALVIGSMAPDFWYILPRYGRDSGHSIPGIFHFCLPYGLAFWLGWRLLVEPSLAPLFPDGIRRSLVGRLHTWRWSDLWAAPLSVVVGAFTHVYWDALTHDNHSEFLDLPSGRIHLLGHQPEVWKVLQGGSSVLGLVVIAIWTLWALRKLRPDLSWNERLWPGAWRAAVLACLVVVPLAAAMAEALPATLPGRLLDLRHCLGPVLHRDLPYQAVALCLWAVPYRLVRIGQRVFRTRA
jgi:hypothetical protein